MADVRVQALRFARARWLRSQVFEGFSHSGTADGPVSCDFFVWLIRSPDRTTLIDTGLARATGDAWGVTWETDVITALSDVGVNSGDVDRVVVTHLHADHVGTLRAFDRAEILLQRAELEFWSDEIAGRPLFRGARDADGLAAIRAAEQAGRLRLLDGDVTIDPTLSVLRCPGHTPGGQLVVVRDNPEIVLLGDVVHFREELDHDWVFTLPHDLEQAYRAFDRVRALEASGRRLVPGHDAELIEAYRSAPLPHGGMVSDLRSPLR